MAVPAQMILTYSHTCRPAGSSSFGAIPDTLPVSQPLSDRPDIQVDRLLVESSLSSAFQRASFLAASAKHSGTGFMPCPLRHVA